MSLVFSLGETLNMSLNLYLLCSLQRKSQWNLKICLFNNMYLITWPTKHNKIQLKCSMPLFVAYMKLLHV